MKLLSGNAHVALARTYETNWILRRIKNIFAYKAFLKLCAFFQCHKRHLNSHTHKRKRHDDHLSRSRFLGQRFALLAGRARESSCWCVANAGPSLLRNSSNIVKALRFVYCCSWAESQRFAPLLTSIVGTTVFERKTQPASRARNLTRTQSAGSLRHICMLVGVWAIFHFLLNSSRCLRGLFFIRLLIFEQQFNVVVFHAANNSNLLRKQSSWKVFIRSSHGGCERSLFFFAAFIISASKAIQGDKLRCVWKLKSCFSQDTFALHSALRATAAPYAWWASNKMAMCFELHPLLTLYILCVWARGRWQPRRDRSSFLFGLQYWIWEWVARLLCDD